jgi:hypothetical protein
MAEPLSTREAWLGQAAAALADEFLEDHDVPPLRISVGFPGGRSNRKTTIGQCWRSDTATDGVNQIFLSPIRGEDDTIKVLATLLHEMIHAIDNCESGHRGNFARIAKACGFVAKLTSSDNHTEEMAGRLKYVRDQVGTFPHAALVQIGRAADEPKKQGTRMLKVVCPDDGYTLRTTQKWLDVGLPTCPCGTEMEASA